MVEDPGHQQTVRRRCRTWWLVVAALLLVGVVLAGLWLLPGALPQASPSPGAVPTFTPAPTLSPTPTVLHPTITHLGAEVDDGASTITFRVDALVPAGRRAAEVLLWYDTEVGQKVRRTTGPLSNPISLSYRLDAAQEGLTRTLTSTSELDYWWLVRDSSGESVRAGGTAYLGPELQALVRPAAPEPPPVGFAWVLSDTRHFQFYYPSGTAAERDRSQIGTVAEAAFGRTRDVLKADFDGQMKAYLVPRVFWQGGATYGDKVQLISYLDRNYTGVETWSYFAHEGTHALAQDLIQPKQEEGGPDGVLVEGLAVWAGDGHYGQEPIDTWAAVVAASEDYIPLAKLRAGPFYDFQHETSYLEAGSFVKFLIEQFGLEKFKEFYGQATGKAEHDDDLAKRLFGKGYDDLESDWLNYLKGLSPSPGQAEAWELQVRSFDVMRRYETELDPDARILPDKTPPEWTSDTLKIFLHHQEAPVNVTLETALIVVQERLRRGAFDSAAALVDDVEAALTAGGRPVRPSLEARQAILGLVVAQDRALLRADGRAYLDTFGPAYVPPAALSETLQLPFTTYEQEVVRLDVADDGLGAQGTVWVHARLADGEFAEDGRLFSVTFTLKDGRWRMVRRKAWVPVLAFPPTAGNKQ